MALLLRMGGVPARVATGFTTGTYDRATKKYLVVDIDAMRGLRRGSALRLGHV